MLRGERESFKVPRHLYFSRRASTASTLLCYWNSKKCRTGARTGQLAYAAERRCYTCGKEQISHPVFDFLQPNIWWSYFNLIVQQGINELCNRNEKQQALFEAAALELESVRDMQSIQFSRKAEVGTSLNILVAGTAVDLPRNIFDFGKNGGRVAGNSSDVSSRMILSQLIREEVPAGLTARLHQGVM